MDLDVTINGVSGDNFPVENTQPETFTNVQAFAAAPYNTATATWINVADAKIKNFVVTEY